MCDHQRNVSKVLIKRNKMSGNACRLAYWIVWIAHSTRTIYSWIHKHCVWLTKKRCHNSSNEEKFFLTKGVNTCKYEFRFAMWSAIKTRFHYMQLNALLSVLWTLDWKCVSLSRKSTSVVLWHKGKCDQRNVTRILLIKIAKAYKCIYWNLWFEQALRTFFLSYAVEHVVRMLIHQKGLRFGEPKERHWSFQVDVREITQEMLTDFI